MSVTNYVKLVWLSWLAAIGFDFFLHAGLLADLYRAPGPFLLPPERAFVLLPVGYASFLVLSGLLVWLMVRLGLRGWRAGLWFGLRLGALIWGAFMLGLYSIATAPPVLLLSWFSGQTIELGLSGLVAGSGLEHAHFGRLLVRVAGFALLSIAAGIVLQNL